MSDDQIPNGDKFVIMLVTVVSVIAIAVAVISVFIV